MSEFKNKSITSKGMELLSKALAGKTLEFTKIQLGSGRYEGEVGIVEELINPIQTLSITKISRKGSQVVLSTVLKLEDITTSFDWTEIGVYAKVDDEEVLYMYGYTENSSYISKDSLNEKLINVTVLVSSVSQVTAVIDDSLVYLTAESLNEHNMDQEAHQDIRKMISSIDLSWTNITNKPEQFEPKVHKHSRNDISDFPTALPANGGNADTVDGSHGWQLQTLNAVGGTHGNSAHVATLRYNADGDNRFKLLVADGQTHQTKVDYATTSSVAENANALNGVTLDSINHSISKAGGDIAGKTIIFEAPSIKGVTNDSSNYTTIKRYTNPKGGMVRLARIRSSWSECSVIKITVDGVVLAEFSPRFVCSVTNDSNISGASSNVDGQFIDIPFKESFEISARVKSYSSVNVQTLFLFYYINS